MSGGWGGPTARLSSAIWNGLNQDLPPGNGQLAFYVPPDIVVVDDVGAFGVANVITLPEQGLYELDLQAEFNTGAQVGLLSMWATVNTVAGHNEKNVGAANMDWFIALHVPVAVAGVALQVPIGIYHNCAADIHLINLIAAVKRFR